MRDLPGPLAALVAVCTITAVVVSAWSIYLQLKNYRKPSLQRMVVRIMVMVPIYGISSLVSLHSLEAAFVIDAIRDIYEAFVIYCFFVLLLTYLGGERSLLIMLHGRPPQIPIFPLSLFWREIDVSDPHTFLLLKRGILQYVQVKPLLAAATLITKACGVYNEGDFRANSGYLYITIIYNISICWALYCLAMFWACVSDDLKPYRPVPKFLCVKGILFFSFWQSVAISVLVATHLVGRFGKYIDPERVSTGWNNVFICVEMPFFAFLHMFAFSYKDYIDDKHTFVARMPFYYAFRDAFGIKDVVEDSKATLRGEGMDYREFEPAEGFMHQGLGREARMRAGLRYSKGGQKKYWLPRADPSTVPSGSRVVNKAIGRVVGEDQTESVHAPLLTRQAQSVVHLAPDMMQDDEGELDFWSSQQDDGYELPFGDIDEADEELFQHSKRYLFGDYNYPCIDVSTEGARLKMWSEEERVLSDERGAWFSPLRGAKGVEAIKKRGSGPVWEGYGAVGTSERQRRQDADEIREVEGARVIDFDQERHAPVEKDGLVMKWTKSLRGHVSTPGSSSSSHAPAMQRVDSSSSSGSRKLVRRSPRSPSPTAPPLPPDAVDLVVEDHSSQDATPGGLRKIYRRGFEADDGKVRGEVEVESQNPEGERRRVDHGERVANAITENPDLAGPPDDERGVLARAETPPLHARVDEYHFTGVSSPHEEDHEHNPWA